MSGARTLGDVAAGPADTYTIAGRSFVFEIADRDLRALIRQHWSSFRVESARRVDAIFRFTDRKPALPKLKTWRTFTNDHVIFLTDGKRYLLTGYLYDHPWQFDGRALPEWDPHFVYYYVVEPILLDVLKKLDVLVWHSAAVEKNGAAILLPGVSGSGKSTTALNLLGLGYRFLADDTALLRMRDRWMEVSGFEEEVYLTARSFRLLPEWRARRSEVRRRKGSQFKYRVDLASHRSLRRRAARVRLLLFPVVTTARETRLQKLTRADALLECLGQAPKEYPASVLGPGAVEKQFEMYSLLTRTTFAYRLHLGSDQDGVRRVLASLNIVP